MTKTPYILVVEDDVWLAEQHVRTLVHAGYAASHVDKALLALDAFDVRVPDAIVLDVFLTGQNAFTLLHEMRSHSDLAAIPIIICTNSASDISSDNLSAYGVQIVLDKTVMHPNDVVAAVKKVLS